jgi:hypothetical protein
MNFPVFPLNGAVLFPNTNLPLNIFEERYIDMVDYALSKDRMIGMIQKNTNDEFFNIGCTGKITSFLETEDGKYQINLQGLNRFFFKKIIENDYKFITIEAEMIKTSNVVRNNQELNKKLLSIFKKFLEEKKLNFNISDFDNLNSISLSKIITIISPLDFLIKQMLLETNENDLCKKLISVLEIEIRDSQKDLKIN